MNTFRTFVHSYIRTFFTKISHHCVSSSESQALLRGHNDVSVFTLGRERLLVNNAAPFAS